MVKNQIDAGDERELAKALKRQTVTLAEISERVAKIEAGLAELQTAAGKVFRKVRHLEPDLHAVLRILRLDHEALPYPQRLMARRVRLASQNEEDGITLALFERIGAERRTFVEIGSGLSGGNSAVLANELGWSGLMVDGDEGHIEQVARRFPGVTAVAAWVTRDNVNQLVEDAQCTGEIDLLSIDLDGNDYWIWEALTACSPRLVIAEYNSIFGPERAVTVPYDPQFHEQNHRFIYYGASLAALTRLARRKGYRLITTEPTGVNAFFLRDDIEPSIPACAVQTAFRLFEKYDVLIQRKKVDIYEYVKDAGLSLVDVD